MNFKTIKILDGRRVVEVKDEYGELMAVVDMLPSPMVHAVNLRGRVDFMRLARHLPGATLAA